MVSAGFVGRPPAGRRVPRSSRGVSQRRTPASIITRCYTSATSVVTVPSSVATTHSDVSPPEQSPRSESTHDIVQPPDTTPEETPAVTLVVSEDMELPGQQLSQVSYDAGVTLTVNRSEAAYHVRVELQECNNHLWEEWIAAQNAAAASKQTDTPVAPSPEAAAAAAAQDAEASNAAAAGTVATDKQQEGAAPITATAAEAAGGGGAAAAAGGGEPAAAAEGEGEAAAAGGDGEAAAAGGDGEAAAAVVPVHPVMLHWGVENWQLPAADVLPEGTVQVRGGCKAPNN